MNVQQLHARPLSLKNDGALEIFFIGVGSAFASQHHQSNFLIIKGDNHIMVDFGMTGPTALLQTAGLKITDIGVLFPSHSHADHVGGIEAIALQNRYVGIPFLKKEKVKIIINEDYQRILWDRTLRGGLEYNEEETDNHRNLSFGDYFNVIRPCWKQQQPREIYEADLGDIHLEIFRTKHIPDIAAGWQESFISYGLFIDGHVFVSIDTRFDLELINLYAEKSSIMFHDAQFFPGGVHSPVTELQSLPSEIKRKMHLMHYADNWENIDISDFAGWAQQGVRYIFD